MSPKKRWLSLLVENEIGVLAYVAGLFAGKSYNLDSLTVGVTEDPSISRMTIGLTSDDRTFEQIKKQLNRSVPVIKVMDYTEVPIYRKEILFVKVTHCSEEEKREVFRMAGVYEMAVREYDGDSMLLECTQTEEKNDRLIDLMKNNSGTESKLSGAAAWQLKDKRQECCGCIPQKVRDWIENRKAAW